MDLDVVQFAAAFLKYLAVPAAAIELLHPKRRDAIEAWLEDKLPKIVKGTAITLFVLYLAVLLLVSLGPWLVLILFFLGRPINWIIIRALQDEDAGLGCAVGGAVASILILIVAALEKWVIPEDWILALAYPYEAFSVWANGHWLVDWLLPDFTARGFLDHYRDVFVRTEEWLWDWVAFFYTLYFFFARGFMVVMVAGIQLTFFASIVFSCILIPLAPLHFIMKLSEYIKERLKSQVSGRLPIVAFLVFATGETLDFAIEAVRVAS